MGVRGVPVGQRDGLREQAGITVVKKHRGLPQGSEPYARLSRSLPPRSGAGCTTGLGRGIGAKHTWRTRHPEVRHTRRIHAEQEPHALGRLGWRNKDEFGSLGAEPDQRLAVVEDEHPGPWVGPRRGEPLAVPAAGTGPVHAAAGQHQSAQFRSGALRLVRPARRHISPAARLSHR